MEWARKIQKKKGFGIKDHSFFLSIIDLYNSISDIEIIQFIMWHYVALAECSCSASQTNSNSSVIYINIYIQSTTDIRLHFRAQ